MDNHRVVDTAEISEQRARYCAAAEKYYDHTTVETSMRRNAAAAAARRAGVREETIRDWDAAVANDMFAGLFALGRI